MIRANGCDLCHDDAEIVSRKRLDCRLAEGHHRIDRGDMLDPGSPRHRRAGPPRDRHP
jgi:hypothetical protein